MAALTESSLTNSPTEDRDSVGYFQMRTSIWDEGPYQGYEHRPELQLRWFIDHALAVKAQSGDPAYGSDPSILGNWIADVEQPAAEYRDRYQLQLEKARELLNSFHAQATPAPPSAVPSPTPPPEPPAARALQLAMGKLGGPATDSDSAALIQSVYSQIGVHLPGSAANQFNIGTPIPRDQLRPGDVIFFQDSTGYIYHEGIYIGDGRFLHTPESGGKVEVSRLDEPYFAQQYGGARRFAADASVHFARTLPVIEPPSARPTITSSGYALPLDAQYMHELGRTDDGVDIETAPDGAVVYSITPGVVSAVASDPSGFGPNYPVSRPGAGRWRGSTSTTATSPGRSSSLASTWRPDSRSRSSATPVMPSTSGTATLRSASQTPTETPLTTTEPKRPLPPAGACVTF
jgi:NlpC/P60 family